MNKYDVVEIGAKVNVNRGRMQIAIANIPVFNSNVSASFRGRPVLTRDRLRALSHLLNEISRFRTISGGKIDLLVFPEVSIPHSWESTIVNWARKHDIGVVCGLEHRLRRRLGVHEAHNEVLAALPYKLRVRHTVCIPYKRLKRHYSPEETFVLENQVLENRQLQIPASNGNYQLFRWRGASFAIYNCYELASIEDRCLFKGKVDFIVVTEFNKDINYFSNIIESVARDIHCFVIQVNDSRFGDSRIVNPSKTESMSPLRIKGGDNITFLTMSLNLSALRDFQLKGYGLQKDSEEFKPTPPGFAFDPQRLEM